MAGDDDEFNEEFRPGLGLVLSNLALVPGLIAALRWNRYTEAAVLLVIAFSSTNYHFCQADFICSFPFRTLQIIDHYTVYSTLIWFYLYLIQIPIPPRFIMLTMSQTLLLPFVMTRIKSIWIPVIVVGSLGVITIISFFYWFKWKKHFSYIDLIPCIAAVSAGFYIHVFVEGDPGDDDYPTYHMVWHILVMAPIGAVIELTEGKGLLHSFLKKFRSKKQQQQQPKSSKKDKDLNSLFNNHNHRVKKRSK